MAFEVMIAIKLLLTVVEMSDAGERARKKHNVQRGMHSSVSR
jgi:hypothetical protein